MPRTPHAPGAPGAPDAPDLETLAASAGTAWAEAFAGELRRQHRAVTGAWPGTVSEARGHVLAALGNANPVPLEHLRALSRTAYRAARTAWLSVAEPDPEP